MLKRLRRVLGQDIRPTESEVLVLRAILGVADTGVEDLDPRLTSIASQLARAQEVTREYPGPDQYRAAPTWTFDDLTFPLEIDRIASDPIVIRDEQTGRELEFRAVIGRSGFLRALEGRTMDGGPWPRDWSIATQPATGGDHPKLVLPSLEEQRAFERIAREALRDWLGVQVPKGTELLPPASSAAVAAAESRSGGPFSDDYKRFLAITDGLETPDIRLFGHRDAYVADAAPWPAVAIAWDSYDVDDFIVVLSLDDEDDHVYRIDVHDEGAKPQSIAVDFRSYLGARLSRRGEGSLQ